MNPNHSTIYDYIIVGAGISGPFIAHELCRAGASCLMIEAGKHYTRKTYPRNDPDGTAQLYWSGGLELGLELQAETEAMRIDASTNEISIACQATGGATSYRGRNLVLASGTIGNTRLLLNSGFGKQLPAVG